MIGISDISGKKMPIDDAIRWCQLGINKDGFRVVPKTNRFVFAVFTYTILFMWPT